MPSVTLHSSGPGGAQTITITQTGVDSAHIDVTGGAVPSEDVFGIKANPTALTLSCQVDAFFLRGDIDVVVQRATRHSHPIATITISHLLIGNGVHVFNLQSGDDTALEAFLTQADFPS